MNTEKLQDDGLGEPGEIKQYDRTGGPDTVRGDELNPNKESDITPIYLTGDSTLQTAEEDAHDRSVDPAKNDKMAASNDDINAAALGRTGGNSVSGGDAGGDDDAE